MHAYVHTHVWFCAHGSLSSVSRNRDSGIFGTGMLVRSYRVRPVIPPMFKRSACVAVPWHRVSEVIAETCRITWSKQSYPYTAWGCGARARSAAGQKVRQWPMAHHKWTTVFSSCSALSAPRQHPPIWSLNHPGRSVPKLTLRVVHLRLAITDSPKRETYGGRASD
jgi:hypothetical protein